MPIWLPNFLSSQESDNEDLSPSSQYHYGSEKDIHTSSSTTAMQSPSSTAIGPPLLPPPALHSGTTSSNSRRNRKKSIKFPRFSVHWARLKKRIGTGTAPSSSSLVGESAAGSGTTRNQGDDAYESADGFVDEVVVDRAWTEDIKSTATPHSEHGATPDKTNSQQLNNGPSEPDSVPYEGFWSVWTPLAILRWRTWPLLMEIFSSRFIDEKAERHFAQVREFSVYQYRLNHDL